MGTGRAGRADGVELVDADERCQIEGAVGVLERGGRVKVELKGDGPDEEVVLDDDDDDEDIDDDMAVFEYDRIGALDGADAEVDVTVDDAAGVAILDTAAIDAAAAVDEDIDGG